MALPTSYMGWRHTDLIIFEHCAQIDRDGAQ